MRSISTGVSVECAVGRLGVERFRAVRPAPPASRRAADLGPMPGFFASLLAGRGRCRRGFSPIIAPLIASRASSISSSENGRAREDVHARATRTARAAHRKSAILANEAFAPKFLTQHPDDNLPHQKGNAAMTNSGTVLNTHKLPGESLPVPTFITTISHTYLPVHTGTRPEYYGHGLACFRELKKHATLFCSRGGRIRLFLSTTFLLLSVL